MPTWLHFGFIFQVLGRLGGLLGASWGVLEASWGPVDRILAHLGTSWGVLGRLGAVLAPFWPSKKPVIGKEREARLKENLTQDYGGHLEPSTS